MSTIPTYTYRYDPALPLAEFVEQHYIPAAGRRRMGGIRGPLKPGRIDQCHRLVRMLKAYLHRKPVVGDLTRETMAAFLAWMRDAFPASSGKGLGITFASFIRFAGIVPPVATNRGKKTGPLSEEPGTLWHVCLHEYFPENLRIRKDQTRLAYRHALTDLKAVIGREPTIADLTDDNLILVMRWNLDRKLAPPTANERQGRIVALWNWLAKRRIVEMFPTAVRVREPRRLPRAWTADELARLFRSCESMPGLIVKGITAADWWCGLHWVQWSTAERIGAILACRWEWLDFATGALEIPAEVRKGGAEDFLHKLRPEALLILARMKLAGHPIIFPWPGHVVTFYQTYTTILKRAGLTHGRRDKTHKMRRSVASHLQAAGVDASLALGHSCPNVTRESYLDPRIVITRKPADVLFNPLTGDLPALPAPAPKLIEYREPPPADVDESLAWIA